MQLRKKYPRIEVILPFHRCDTLLSDAIESTLSSRAVEVTLLLVDDRIEGGDTKFIPREHSQRIELIRNNSNRGYGSALKAGTAALQGKFVGLMNSDDLIHPDKFRSQLETLKTHDLSITRMLRRDKSGKQSVSLTGDFKGSNYYAELLLLGAYGANATWAMHTDWWKKNSFFDSDHALDWRIALHAFPNSVISLIKHPYYFYTRHEKQTTANLSVKSSQDFEALFLAWQLFAENIVGESLDFNCFQVFAAPWLTNPEVIDVNSLNSFVTSLLEYLTKYDSNASDTFLPLIHRRLIFSAFRNSISLPGRLALLNKSKAQLIPLLIDLLQR